MTERIIPPRRDVKAKLRELDMTHRQIDALLRLGWRGLVGETKAELIETQEALRHLQTSLKSVE